MHRLRAKMGSPAGRRSDFSPCPAGIRPKFGREALVFITFSTNHEFWTPGYYWMMPCHCRDSLWTVQFAKNPRFSVVGRPLRGRASRHKLSRMVGRAPEHSRSWISMWAGRPRNKSVACEPRVRATFSWVLEGSLAGFFVRHHLALESVCLRG